MEGQALEDEEIEFLGTLEGKAFDTVTILDNINAKAVKVAWEDIEGIIAEENEYVVDYAVNPFEGASVKGAESVAEGENLYFAVEPEEGYEISGVYANGEELEQAEVSELASASDWGGYAYVYVAEGVAEDLAVEIEMAETESIIPAATYTKEADDGTIFTIDVPDGAFSEEVELKIQVIDDDIQLKEFTDQANGAVKADKAVAGIMAYDVSFVSVEDGREIEPAKPVGVSLRFKKKVETEETKDKEVTGISVVHLPENDKAQVVADTENVKEKEFEFQTDGNCADKLSG